MITTVVITYTEKGKDDGRGGIRKYKYISL